MMYHGIKSFDAKTALLEQLVAGKAVLHIGAIGETDGDLAAKVAAAPRSVHATLTRRARECVGVDIDRQAVDALTRSGAFSNLLTLDATTVLRDDIPLSVIDVIVAGDVVEHMTNPGDLLRQLRSIADPDTVLVLTTPNAASLPQFVRYLRGRPLEGPDHVCSFNIYSLTNLLERCGWALESASTCHQGAAARAHGSLTFVVGRALLRRWPALGGTLLATCVPTPAGAR
jgi:hypothetical protein